MKVIILLIVCFFTTIICFSQTNDANIIAKNLNIELYHPDLHQTLKGKGIIRLTFDNKDSLNVIYSEIVYLSVFDSLTNQFFFKYRIGQNLNRNKNKIRFYKRELDSIFKNIKFHIVDKNYTHFIPKADFVFIFMVYPKRDK